MTAATLTTRGARSWLTWSVCFVALAASACAGSDDTTGGGAGMSAADHDAGSVRFADIYKDILFKRCSDTACHGGGAAMLDMSTRDKAYLSLIGVTAVGPECKGLGLTRVVAGKPADSLLYKKVDNTQPCGRRMPLGGELDTDSIARIEAWIADGAKND